MTVLPLGYRLVSDSHHLVGTNGRDWVKVAVSTDEVAAAEIMRDFVVSAAIGSRVALLRTAGLAPRWGMRMPDFGEPLSARPVSDLTAKDVIGVVDGLLRVAGALDGLTAPDPVGEGLVITHPHHVDVTARIDTSATLVDSVRAKLAARVAARAAADPGMIDVGVWCHDVLDRVEVAALRAGAAVLVHADPHWGNVLCDSGTGRLTLIDWESAVFGPPEIGLAALAHTLIVQGRRDLVGVLTSTVSDTAAFDAGLLVKVVSAVSWLGWRHGSTSVPARLDILAGAGIIPTP